MKLILGGVYSWIKCFIYKKFIIECFKYKYLQLGKSIIYTVNLSSSLEC